MALALSIAIPLGASMVITGAVSLGACAKGKGEGEEDQGISREVSDLASVPLDSAIVTVQDGGNSSGGGGGVGTDGDGHSLFRSQHGFPPVMVPVWLVVAGAAVLFAPLVYLAYDKYWKCEEGGPLVLRASKLFVVGYLLCGLVWAVLGFLWVFGGRDNQVGKSTLCSRLSGLPTNAYILLRSLAGSHLTLLLRRPRQLRIRVRLRLAHHHERRHGRLDLLQDVRRAPLGVPLGRLK